MEKDVVKKIKQILVSRNFDNSYTLFGKYKIVSNEQGLFKAEIINAPESRFAIFSSLKNAVTWCTLEQRSLIKEVQRIQDLDDLIAGFDVELALIKKKIANCSDEESRSIFQAKFKQLKLKKATAMKEIELLVEDSKYWQSKKFAELESKINEEKDKYILQDWNTNHEIKRL